MVTSNGGEYEDESALDEAGAIEEDEPGLFDVARKWSWLDTAYITSCAWTGFFSVLTAFAGNIGAQIRAHEDYRRSGRDFASSVMDDINKL
jgi:hypothetical protein